MTRIVNLIACLAMAMSMLIPAVPAAAMQPQDSLFDLASVPLSADALPESGYQVLTGGYLERELTTTWIAAPRNLEPGSVDEMLTSTGWVQSYVIDHVLLKDRAFAESDILALIQTNVYLFADEEGAEDAVDTLDDFSEGSGAEEVEPVIQEAWTVRLTTQDGDTYRSVARHERTVIEVVSLDRFGYVDLEQHRRVTADTFDRLGDLHAMSSQAVAPHALLITDGVNVADLFNAQQTGVHQIYRVRDDAVQPAAGELEPPDVESIAPGLAQLYLSSQAINIGQGNGFYSSWIGDFRSEDEAGAFVASLPESSSGALLPDPYFTSWGEEEAISQGVAGLYRVTGVSASGSFSGTLEIQQLGTRVIGIGWRTFGEALPSVDVTSRLMDAQLTCIDDPDPCPLLPLDELLPPESATPIPSTNIAGNRISSDEFGWSLALDEEVWTVNERFAEPGYDFVELQAGNSLVTLESVIDQHGDPEQCVLDEMHALQDFEDDAVIELGSDDPDEVPAGLQPGHGWGIYTVEPLADERADQEYTIRIDCFTIIENGASLIVTQRAPRYDWNVEREKGEMLRDALELPVISPEHGILARQQSHNWRCNVINRIWIGCPA